MGAAYFLNGKVEEDAVKALVIMTAVVVDAFGANPQPASVEEGAILMNAAGVLINAASLASDSVALHTGEDWMTRVVESGLLVGTRFESAAVYDLANSRLGIALALGGLTPTQWFKIFHWSRRIPKHPTTSRYGNFRIPNTAQYAG
ncbi:hypothetical protein ACLMAJ_29725 [Nocardia sp. KC 131]|uniref:hypothetical protein n=1 Tax=Nocardia arseniciresistens TaxID=3392119 RepID=UPI00398ECE14